MRPDTLIDQLLAEHPVILAREHRDLRNTLVRATTNGRLVRLLPGVYVDAQRSSELATRVAAAGLWDPSAVVCGRAAAALTYWPSVEVGPIAVASPVAHTPQPGFTFTKRRIPAELISSLSGVRVTSPSLTAMDLATMEFSDPIDIALRKRVVSLESLSQALELTPHRRGQRDRRRVLLDSRAEPWSRAERLAHRLFWRDGLTGWVTNDETILPGAASTYYLDIAFRKQRLACEIDGRIHETDLGLFESDRERQNSLVLHGWLVLRFTWRMLNDDPDYVISTTRRALRVRRDK